MNFRRAHFRFACHFYGFEVEAHGEAIPYALHAAERHGRVCPYCKGERIPASEFQPGSPKGREAG